MKRIFTSLFFLLMLIGFNMNAITITNTGFTSEGVYTFKSVLQGVYLASNATDAIAVASPTSEAQFLVLENESNPGKYNIVTLDKQYVLCMKEFKLYKTADNFQNDTLALITFPDAATSNSSYLQTGDTAQGSSWGVNCPSTTDIGYGKVPSYNKYHWYVDSIADLPPSGVPVVSMTAPETNIDILPNASVLLKASATGTDGATITAVEFLVDDVKVGDGVYNGTDDVWEYTWTGSATEATYAVKAKATSSTAQVSTSDPINVIVATNPATITLTWPSSATTILPNKQVTLTATASPATGETISKVEFYEGANLLGEGTLNSDVYELDIHIDEITTYSITAKITDSGSNIETTAAVDLTTSLTTAIISSYSNFESGLATDDWSWQGTAYNASILSYVVNENAPSTANKVLMIDFDGSTAKGATSLLSNINGLAGLTTTGRVYIKYAYAADNTVQKCNPNLTSSKWTTTPGTATAAAGGVFSPKAWSQTTATYIDAGNQTIFAAIRLDNLADGGKLYFDDIVMYYDPIASGTDGTAPTAPSAATAPTVTDNQIVLTWTEGYDAGIGIDSTYIFRTLTSEAAPTLIDQVGYSIDNIAAGLPAAGNWDLVGMVPLGTKTFTDNTVVNGTTAGYVYAIVHKDYAYNYSESATVSTVPTGLAKQVTSSVRAFGTTGAIQVEALSMGQAVSVYSLSGAEVFAAQAQSSNMTIDLPQGLYVVKAADAIQKVMVK